MKISEIEQVAVIEELSLMLGECIGRLEARHHDIDTLKREILRLEGLTANRLLSLHYMFPHGVSAGYDILGNYAGFGIRTGFQFHSGFEPFISFGLSFPLYVR